MPIEYELKEDGQRVLTLKSDLRTEPELSVASLVHGVVKDLLHASGYAHAHFDEFVDMAVIATGLGTVLSNIDFVSKQGTFWDTTQWRLIPRPFLDSQGVAYVNAMAAWARNEKNPEWAEDLGQDLRRSMLKSLKFLNKTDDTFLRSKNGGKKILGQSQKQWLEMAVGKSVSSQIIAIRHLNKDEPVLPEQQRTITEKLRSTDDSVLVNAISASEQIVDVGENAIEELQFLTRHRDHVVRAKAMCALTRLGKLDETSIQRAGEMLGSKQQHEIYSGLMALSSLGSISDNLIPPINKAFIRSLQVCNYEFVGLFASAFTKWLNDPKAHVEDLMQDSPEYLEIAMEALENANDQLVGLK